MLDLANVLGPAVAGAFLCCLTAVRMWVFAKAVLR